MTAHTWLREALVLGIVDSIASIHIVKHHDSSHDNHFVIILKLLTYAMHCLFTSLLICQIACMIRLELMRLRRISALYCMIYSTHSPDVAQLVPLCH